MIEQTFFGHPESPLFGVYHRPRGARVRPANRAAIICPPIGQEYNRTHWTIRLLANQVARKGIHILRMDYHGIGDSAQSIEQIDSLECWRRNIEQAIDHVKMETGCETVMLIGQRFGASLAAQVAMRRPDVNGVVAWDPILNGQQYINALRKTHATMLDLWVCKMSTTNDAQYEEILGSCYQRSLIGEIEQLSLNFGNLIQPQLIAVQSAQKENYVHPEPGLQHIIEETRASSWYELGELESAYLRPDTMRQIVKKIDDMFERLEQRGALSIPPQQLEATS